MLSMMFDEYSAQRGIIMIIHPDYVVRNANEEVSVNDPFFHFAS